VRDEQLGYSSYADGSEELYDEVADPKRVPQLVDSSEHSGPENAAGKVGAKSSAPTKPTGNALLRFPTYTWKLRK